MLSKFVDKSAQKIMNFLNQSEFRKKSIGEKNKIWVALDEVQKCPHLFDQIKILYDKYKDSDKLKFILTGSAVLSLHQLSAETLAGRIELHYLQEFTLREGAFYNELKILGLSLFDHLDEAPEKIGHFREKQTGVKILLHLDILQKHSETE